MKKIILAIIFSIISMPIANAQSTTSKGKISEIRVSNRKVDVVQENAVYPEDCSDLGYFMLSVPAKNEFSTLMPILIAYQSGKEVTLKVSSCNAGIPFVDEVILQ